MTWLKWVIEYDLGKQAGAVSTVRKFFAGGDGSGPAIGPWLKKHKRSIPIVLAVTAFLWWGLRRLRRRTVGEPRVRITQKASRAYTAYQRAERALARRGLSRNPSETAAELARRAIAANDPGAAPFSDLVALYYTARFGDQSVDAATLDRLARDVITPPNQN
jgi:hypothetical protein